MCDTFVHPRPAFSTFLKSSSNGPVFKKILRKSYPQVATTVKREFRHGKTKTGRNVLTFDPTFNPMIDEIAGTVSSALELSLVGKHSPAGSGGMARLMDRSNINKPPHKSTPSLNERQTFCRPQTAPARFGASDSAEKKLSKSGEVRAAETANDLLSRLKDFKDPNFRAATVETEDSGMLAYRIIGGQLVPKMSVSLPGSPNERNAIELKARYTSVTHKTLEEIPWAANKAVKASRESRPDMVTQKVHRYETKAHAWQAIGPAFDRAQSRRHNFCNKPINYISESRQTQYTPGYTGEVPLTAGELGVPDTPLHKKTRVSRDLPPPTVISRKANIVGYTGHVRPGTTQPAHCYKPASTQNITHRAIPVGESQGDLYPRVNPISNLVTLTHPYNPYNPYNPTTTDPPFYVGEPVRRCLVNGPSSIF